MQAKLNKSTVSAVATAGPGDLWIWDTEIKGFGLRVRPNGRKVYVVEYRPGAGGRTAPKRRYTIGTHGSPWTADSARDEAKRILGLAKSNRDPSAERTEARLRPGETVEERGAEFIEKYAKKKQRGWRDTESMLKRELYPAVGKMRLHDVTKQDVLIITDRIAERAPGGANRTFAAIRKFFNWCVERGYIADSPCKGLKPPGEVNERDRVLSDDELAEVWRAADALSSLWAPLFRILILTAQRRSEVAGMRWSELDLEKKLVWTIPQARAKNKSGHEVPLCETAVKLLKAVPRVEIEVGGRTELSPFVFTTTGTTAVSGFSKAKLAWDAAVLASRRKAAEEAGEGADAVEDLPEWTIHDLRRTATTGMAGKGIAPHVVDAILNHKSGAIRGVAKVYNRYAYLPERRRALEVWEAHVLGLLNGASDNVVPIDMARKNA